MKIFRTIPIFVMLACCVQFRGLADVLRGAHELPQLPGGQTWNLEMWLDFSGGKED